MTATAKSEDNKWKDYWIVTQIPDKVIKKKGKQSEIRKQYLYQCKHCSDNCSLIKINPTKLNHHTRTAHKEQWIDWNVTLIENPEQSTMDQYLSNRPLKKLLLPEKHDFNYKQSVAMRTIRGNYPFSHFKNDWFWDTERKMYLNPPQFSSKYFKNNLLTQMFIHSKEKIKEEINRDTANIDKSISIMLDGYDYPVSLVKIVNFYQLPVYYLLM